jgi:oligopeptide/dipeptide ABC transporter ATP-binding protein
VKQTADNGLSTGPSLVEVRGLVKHFRVSSHENLVAVAGVDLVIGEGETVGLVGESGSGKTTLGRLILRLVEPTRGEIWYRGERIGHLPDRVFRRLRPKFQMVFQDPSSSLNPRMTIRQALNDAVAGLKLSRRDREARIQEIVETISLPPGLLDAHPEALTQSQQQRCAVARALVMQPDLIVLDEPVSNLDVMGRLEIIDLLRDVQSRYGVSYIFISHDLTAVRRLSHRVAVMYLGSIVETALTAELFARPVHPYTRSLLSAVLYPDPDAAAPAYVLEGEIPSPINLPSGCPLFSRCPVGEPECTRWEPELIPLSTTGGPSHTVACRRCHELASGALAVEDSRLADWHRQAIQT